MPIYVCNLPLLVYHQRWEQNNLRGCTLKSLLKVNLPTTPPSSIGRRILGGELGFEFSAWHLRHVVHVPDVPAVSSKSNSARMEGSSDKKDATHPDLVEKKRHRAEKGKCTYFIKRKQRFCRNRASDLLLDEQGIPLNITAADKNNTPLQEVEPLPPQHRFPLCTTHHPAQLEKRQRETKILMAKSQEARLVQPQTDTSEKQEEESTKKTSAKWSKHTRVSSSQNRMINPMRSYYQVKITVPQRPPLLPKINSDFLL